jgi:hypothetical protein
LYGDYPDGLVVGNPNEEGTAHVELFFVPEGKRDEESVTEFDLGPGESRTEELLSDFVPGSTSRLRTGGIFRVYSDLPVIAYQHAPLRANRGNESALLLPDNILGQDYVVASFPGSDFGSGTGRPSYFEIVALEDGTRVEWTPRFRTTGDGLPIPPVLAGETGSIIMNRYETMRIVPSANDLPDGPDANLLMDVSGTVIHASNPIWVTGATRGSRVPIGNGGTGDQLQEILFPLNHWGKKYVAVASHVRSEDEQHFWRVFAGAPGVTITSDPPLPDFPVTLEERGEYIDVEVGTGETVLLEGDAAFLPVEYLQSRNTSGVFPNLPYGDSAMVQMVPVEQYLDRYVFATGVGFFYNFVQVIREAGGADIVLDGTTVTGYELPIGGYEVVTIPIDEGTHVAESDGPFGIVQMGYAKGEPGDEQCDAPPDIYCNSSYAYPGGMKADMIYVP